MNSCCAYLFLCLFVCLFVLDKYMDTYKGIHVLGQDHVLVLGLDHILVHGLKYTLYTHEIIVPYVNDFMVFQVHMQMID